MRPTAQGAICYTSVSFYLFSKGCRLCGYVDINAGEVALKEDGDCRVERNGES